LTRAEPAVQIISSVRLSRIYSIIALYYNHLPTQSLTTLPAASGS
jgi:hypothetical protein